MRSSLLLCADLLDKLAWTGQTWCLTNCQGALPWLAHRCDCWALFERQRSLEGCAALEGEPSRRSLEGCAAFVGEPSWRSLESCAALATELSRRYLEGCAAPVGEPSRIETDLLLCTDAGC